jgi:hypothetical protein
MGEVVGQKRGYLAGFFYSAIPSFFIISPHSPRRLSTRAIVVILPIPHESLKSRIALGRRTGRYSAILRCAGTDPGDRRLCRATGTTR